MPLLRSSYERLRGRFGQRPILSAMSLPHRTLSGLALGALVAFAAAGVAAEATRVPDQP
jgi:hypothetical protein